MLLAFLEPVDSIHLAVLWREMGNITIYLYIDRFLGQNMNFRGFVLSVFWQVMNPVVFSSTIFTNFMVCVSFISFTVP